MLLLLGAAGFFKDNKSSYTLVSIGLVVVKLYVEVIKLNGEREVENIRVL